jgi:hypothetical protein
VATDNSQQTPDIAVAQAGPTEGDGPWLVAFNVLNRRGAPVELIDAWLPHARFNAAAQELNGLTLAAGESTRIAFTAAYDEPPGTAAENAFVIIRLRWRGEAWRHLTRMTVTSGSRGEPSATVETVSCHRVGFSAE